MKLFYSFLFVNIPVLNVTASCLRGPRVEITLGSESTELVRLLKGYFIAESSSNCDLEEYL
jgi:hypothetical protein